MKIRNCCFSIALFLIPYLTAHAQEIHPEAKAQLDKTIERWFASTGIENSKNFENLLTDDFQLMAFGKRFDKKETVVMMQDYSDIKYTLNNVRYGADGAIGFITFGVEMVCKWKGQPTKGEALETYLFRKVNDQWKIHTKLIVMVDAK